MQKVQLGKSDLYISPIAFGAFPIGGWRWGVTNDKEAVNAMRASVEGGITSIDTAPVYGLGHSEKIVGRLIEEVGRDRVEILTKFGWNWKMPSGDPVMRASAPGDPEQDVYSNASKESILMEVEDSLRRLKTDYIDLYQLHRPDPNTSMEEVMETLVGLKEQGKIRTVGVSNCTVEQMKVAESVIPLASTQSPFSMIYRKIEKDIVPHSVENEIGILAYSPLQRGLLTGKIKPGHQFDSEDYRGKNKFFKESNVIRTNEFLEKIKPIAENHNATLGQLVINWTLRRPGITCALVGSRKAEQMEQNAASLDFTLAQEEIDKINAELEKVVIE